MRTKLFSLITSMAIAGGVPIYLIADTPTTAPTAKREHPATSASKITNADKTFSLKISDQWTRDDDHHSAPGDVMTLIIQKGGMRQAWINVDEDEPLDDVDAKAKHMAALEMEINPDLNKDCKVESVKIDGVDARMFKFRNKLNHFAVYLANHDSHRYRIICDAGDSDLAATQKQIDEVIESFSWETKK